MWEKYNPNPHSKLVGDCVIRAVSKATDQEWGEAYLGLCIQGYVMGDLPSSNIVWGAYLKRFGFKRNLLPVDCPECYTIDDFCTEHPNGVYVIGTGSHAVSICDGKYFDAWDSGQEQPIYYYSRSDM